MAVTNILIETNPEILLCKFCGSSSVVKYGFSTKLRQRHLCIKCNRTFLNNAAPERMRYPTEVIASAICLFYEGSSLHSIKHQLEANYNEVPDTSSIYDWVFNYTRKAIDALKSTQPAPGTTWLISETEVKLKSTNPASLWIWDCIDVESGFLLDSHLTHNNGEIEATRLLEGIYHRNTGQKPQRLIIHRTKYTSDAIKKEYQTQSLHQAEEGLPENGQPCPGLKLLQTTIRNRTNIINGLSTKESAYLVMKGWGIHYNFFRPDPASHGITPATAAGIDLPIKNWADLMHKCNSINVFDGLEGFKTRAYTS